MQWCGDVNVLLLCPNQPSLRIVEQEYIGLRSWSEKQFSKGLLGMPECIHVHALTVDIIVPCHDTVRAQADSLGRHICIP